MPYRIAEDPAVDARREEAREVARMRRAGAQRRWLVRSILALGAASGVSLAVFFGAVSTPKTRTVCHQVTLRYENAPQLPNSTWMACVEKPVGS